MSSSKIHKYQSGEVKVKSWDLPFMEDARPKAADSTNAINKASDWKYEPPELEEEILPPTAEEIEAIRQSAYQEGFEQGKEEGFAKGHEEGLHKGLEEGQSRGFEAGHAEGLESGRLQMQEQTETWQKLATELTQPVNKVDKQLEKELVQLAVTLARSVIYTEIQTNENIIYQAISEGLKVLPIQERRYQFRMHPEDIALVREHFSADEIESHHWQFVETPDMARGGCDIVTDTNAVDVTIERRVRQVLDKFLLEQGMANHKKQGQ
ncbi:flagellar assembly protein FliH [Aliiglaciecola sp. CAU 1673]|uniref:flagellar assembly protein FliH n=1 Tax=Aliiglaciecola sp. CAU 1673 TaxID=3032595 RepID=UPI0023DBA60F|nr:flagellar assembly protein FliH [Aliiglaciecola sp. CAU 1673]MDF2178291.1 flagellar assembly protein FliH [Aliiglaciecola sp. CAU 1673]